MTIQAPATNYINSLPIISGQSTDPAVNLTGVQVAISTGGAAFTNFFWNGTSWQAGPTPYWFNAAPTDSLFNSGSEAWNLTGASTPTWVNGLTYKVQAQSTDEAALSSTIVSTTFTYDNAAPTLAIKSPLDATPQDDTQPRISTISLVGGVAAIIGTAADSGPSGVGQVQVRVRYNDIAEWYNPAGGGFTIPDGSAGTAWFNAVTSNSWVNWYSTFSFSTDSRFRVEAQVRDVAGNYSVNYATASFVMDQDVPQSSVSYPLNNRVRPGHHAGADADLRDVRRHGGGEQRVGADGVVRDQGVGAAEQREVVERGQLVQLKQPVDERQREFVVEFVDVREYLDGEHDVGDELLRDGAIAGQRDAGQRRGIFLGEIGDVHL